MQGLARLLQRTDDAFGRLGRTLNGAEVHDGLIVEAADVLVAIVFGFWHQVLRQGCKRLFTFRRVDGRVDAEMTAEDAIDIAVDHCCRMSEGDAGDGCCRIVANTLELFDLLQRIGEMT